MGGFSRKFAAALLAHSWGKAELAKPANVYLALTTVVPTSSSTGATITEATGATGYGRIKLAAADISAAAEGETSTIENAVEKAGAAITLGSAKVIGWALCTTEGTGTGDVIMWGSCTETVISTTQTPPTIAAKALKGELK